WASFSPPRETYRGGRSTSNSELSSTCVPGLSYPGTRPARTSACACARLSARPRSTRSMSTRFFTRRPAARARRGAGRRCSRRAPTVRSFADRSRALDRAGSDLARGRPPTRSTGRRRRGEDVDALAAVWAHEAGHILDPAEDRKVGRSQEVDELPRVEVRDILRADDDDCAGEPDDAEQLLLEICCSGR